MSHENHIGRKAGVVWSLVYVVLSDDESAKSIPSPSYLPSERENKYRYFFLSSSLLLARAQ